MASEIRTKLGTKTIVIVGMIVASCALVAYNYYKGQKAEPKQTVVPLGLDLRGGTELHYRIRPETAEDKKNLTQRTIDIIRRRIDPTGTKEMQIRERGQYSFLIQLPGMQPEEAALVEERMQKAGKLLFCLVAKDEEAAKVRYDRTRLPAYSPYLPYDEKGVKLYKKSNYRLLFQEMDQAGSSEAVDFLLIANTPEITGEYLNPQKVHPTTDENQRPAIGFEFDGKGAKIFARATERHIGERLAIVLDGVVHSSPAINSRISGPGIIQGSFTRAEVEELIKILQAGSLPADIELEWRSAVGPELGEDSIRQGVMACLVALIVVAGFMAVYYLVTGLAANFALMVNIIFIIAALSGLQATLTLPGIAGLVLTLGMAVDANVLINERIREERERGRTPILALKVGHERAFSAIFDGNLTTFLTGLVLWIVGTGPIRGFATVLCIGLITSTFTAIVVSRLFLEWLLSANLIKEFRMFHLFRKPNIPFTSLRYPATILSLLLALGGIVIWVARGEKKYDNDFTGGFMAEMELAQPMALEEFRKRVGAAGYPNADVQTVATIAPGEGRRASVSRLESKAFTIRIKGMPEEQKRAKMLEDLNAAMRKSGLISESDTLVAGAEPWAFTAKLVKSATALEVRGALEAAEYKENVIESVIIDGKLAGKYEIRLGGLPEGDKRTFDDIAEEVREKLAKRVEQREMAMTADAPIASDGQNINGQNAPTVWQQEITFDKSAPIQAIEYALQALAFPGDKKAQLEVAGRDLDAGRDVGRRVLARTTKRDALQRLANYSGQAIKIPIFAYSGRGVDIELAAPAAEKELRAELGASVERVIGAIIPLEVNGDQIVLRMKPLDEGKVLQIIAKDLSSALSSEIAQKKVDISFEPVERPAFLSDVNNELNDDDQFFAIKLKDSKMMLQQIGANLASAHYPDALVVEGEMREVGEEFVDSVVIKLKADPENPEKIKEAQDAIAKVFQSPRAFRRLETIGPTVAGELLRSGQIAAVLSVLLMLVYLALRFGKLKYGVGACVALVHDVIITMGAVALADMLAPTVIGQTLGFSNIKVNLSMVAAFLTLIGYSVNDTIVVFDRIRENLGGGHRRLDAPLIDNSINQTLSRTVLTSFTVFLVCGCLYVFAGPVVHGFAFVMTFGVVIGSYSSIFIAAPIILDWEIAGEKIRSIMKRQGQAKAGRSR